MVKGIGGLGFLDTFHCEKTSFITAGALAGIIYFAYLSFFRNEIPTFDIPFTQDTMSWLLLFLVIFLAGYAGVIYYRYTYGKCIVCKETLKFWDARA